MNENIIDIVWCMYSVHWLIVGNCLQDRYILPLPKKTSFEVFLVQKNSTDTKCNSFGDGIF